MKKLLASVCCLLFAGVVSAQLTVQNTGSYYFYQFKPPHYNNTDLFPLIISLHGGGEAGDGSLTNLTRVLESGIPKLANRGATLEFTYNGVKEGFVMLAPQCLTTEVPSWPTHYIDEMIAYGINNLRADPNRIFLVGYSYGGTGTWNYAVSSGTNAAKLAGIVPAAPTGASGNFCNIAQNKVAVWAFHGKGDNEAVTINAVNAINACSGLIIPAVDSVYPDGGHDIYNPRVYDTTNNTHYPNVYQWMLKVRRNLVDPNSNTAPVPQIAGGPVINLTTPLNVKDFPVLNGSGSTDNDDIVMDYLWEQTTGPTLLPVVQNSGYREWPTVKVALGGGQFKVDVGTYNFRLRVRDYLTSKTNHTQFANLTVNVALPGAYSAPATDVNVGNDVVIASNVSQVLQVQGNASAYTCTGCNVVGYNWVKISGPSATLSDFNSPGQPYGGGGNAISFTNLNSPGVYKFQFSATTQHGEVGTSVLTITKLGALPVTYSYFTGQNAGGSNILNWATSAELNSERFDIQRSADGASFATIGSLASKGGSFATNYTFSDNNAAPGVSYYRLSQVDKDGRKSLSQVVSVNNKKAGIYIERYPNPVHDNLTVTVQSITSGNTQFAIADMQGKIIMQQQWQKDQSLFKKVINVRSLQNGVYQVIVTIGSEKQISSFVKY